MVTAQFTGISLQKDDRAFVKYSEDSGTYLDQSNIGVTNFLHQDINSIYKPEWSSFHIKASNDAFIQCVSIFAIGYANQFVASDGGDQSITNSNSNFGQRSLSADGFRTTAFPKDDHGFITHVIPPKDLLTEEQNITTYVVDKNLSNTTTKIYLKDNNDFFNPPSSKIRGYSIGGKQSDKIYYKYSNTEYFANITPNYKIELNITSVVTDQNFLTLTSVVGISTGLSVKIFSRDSLLPDGIEHDKIYYVRPFFGSNVRIYENLSNCISDVDNTGNSAVDLKTTIGLSSNNLYLVSSVSDISSGEIGSPIQWDSTAKNWYLSITINGSSPNFLTTITSNNISPSLYLKRVIDTRTDDDRIYRFRYVVPKDSTDAAVPATGFIVQKSGQPLNSTYAQSSDTILASGSGNQLATVRNTNVIVDIETSSGTVTVLTKNPHNLKVGNKIRIYNVKSSSEPNPVGLGTGTGFNGRFEVASVTDDVTFTYNLSRDPGSITSGTSTTQSWLNLPRNCGQTSNFRVPPYTIYSDNRGDLPYFTCDEVENNYQLYNVKEIQRYAPGSSDGVYHLSLDVFKNTPTVSPFNIDQYKLGQNLDNFYPQQDFDNLSVDPNPSTSAASRKTIGLVNVNDPQLSSSKETLVQYLKDFDFGISITGFSKSGSNVTITTSKNHGIGGLKTVQQNSFGSSYLNGTYYDIPLCGGTGSNATINLRVSGGVPVAASFEISNPGSGYTVGDVLTIKGIPGSTSTTTVSVSGLNFDANDSDLIQVIGATNSENNGAFVISSVTANTITYVNASGSNEASTNAVFVMSGPGFPISTGSYNSTSNVTTITTGSLSPHSLVVGNKVLFDVANLGICTVTSVSGISTFTVSGDASTATRSYYVGLVPTLRDTNSSNENLSARQYSTFTNYKNKLLQSASPQNNAIYPTNVVGLKKGDYIQISNEIMLVTKISGGEVNVKRSLFGTQVTTHPINSAIKTIKILPVELRRPSILRASGHTFEYIGFGPGNYSTAMPSNQTKTLNSDEVRISQALPSKGGSVLYSGMNSNGEFFIGRRKWNASTGVEIESGLNQEVSSSADFDSITVNTIIANKEIDASTATAKVKDLIISGTSSFENGITVTGIVTATSFSGNGITPIGGIIMWSGTIANIPTGWALCNGSNSTPDLRNKFIVGAHSGAGIGTISTAGPTFNATTGALSDNYTPGNSGGTTAHQLITTELASHTHGVPDANQNFGFGGNSFDTGGNAAFQNIATTATGGDNYHENRPPYYALAFIMRVS
jgi:microcystin-dependent protein